MDTLHYAPGLVSEGVKSARVWQNFHWPYCSRARWSDTVTVLVCMWVTVLVGVDPVDY
jgi:hypothetical protein